MQVVYAVEVMVVLKVPMAIEGELPVNEVVVVPIVHFVQEAVAVLLPDPLLSFPSLSTNYTSYMSMYLSSLFII